jgi:Tol biopolymer transport system component
MVMLRKLALFAAGFAIQATLAQAQAKPVYRTVFNSDSITVRYPTVSPDERWLVFTVLVSDDETKLMIQPLAGGSPRDLFAVKGYHDYPRFVPAGDRLVFVSDLPSRDPADNKTYLVSAPFDTRTGELSGAPRQISLDGVTAWSWRNPAISPDGRSIAYVAGANAIKVIPLTGGTARTLIEAKGFATSLAWSPDGRFLNYETADGQEWVRMQVSLDGDPPIVKVRSSERLGPLSQDGRYSFWISFGGQTGPSNFRWFDTNGRLLGETKLPPFVQVVANLGAHGRYIPVASEAPRTSVKVVAVSGGPIRKVSAGNSWDWPGGWSADGKLVQVMTEDQGHAALAQYTVSGELKSQVRLPDDVRLGRAIGIRDGHLIYRGEVNTPQRARLMALSLKDGRREELAQDFLPGSVLPPLGAGYFIGEGEFYYRQSREGRVELRAMRPGEKSRLIGEFPASALASAIVFQNRIVYTETVKDTLRRLQLIAGLGQPPKTLATLGAAPYVTWSQDGRQLLVSVGTTQKFFIYTFDADGNVQGLPKVLQLPFEESYGAIWLPDGSGLTMIARPYGSKASEIVVVRLADPQNPVLLTKDDPEPKSSFVLSPDGKYVAYASSDGKEGAPWQRHLSGSSIYLIDVELILKQLQARK